MKNIVPYLCVLLLCACGKQPPPPGTSGTDVLLYLAVDFSVGQGGPGVGGRSVPVDDFSPESVMKALLSSQSGGGYVQPFPEGTCLLSCVVEGGVAAVDLSAHYGQLSGVALTVADVCATLTLCGLPGVDRVQISVEGAPHPARDHRSLSSRDVLLDAPPLRSYERTLMVYGIDSFGALVQEERRVVVRDNSLLESYVVSELLRDHGGSGFASSFPPETLLLMVFTERGVCHVSFSSASLREMDETAARDALTVLVYSLTALDDINAVQFLLDGGPVDSFGGRPAADPLTRESLVADE